VGEGVAARAHLGVVEGPASAPSPGPGRGVVVVSLAELSGVEGFGRDALEPVPNGPPSVTRRVLAVRFRARLDFFQRPVDGTPTALGDARTLQLTDVSLAAHRLAAPEVRDGGSFTVDEADPGFRVREFRVEAGTVAAQLNGSNLVASLTCTGEADLWPPGETQAGGVIAAVDTMLTPLPVRIEVDGAPVRSGQTATIRLRSFEGRRLIDAATGRAGTPSLAVVVASDLPPARRGQVLSGSPGIETGVRIVPVTGPDTVVSYRAPSGDLGSTRIEYVNFHLAAPDDRKGLFLGAVAVNLTPSQA